jgi:hypothetical protein
VKQLKNPSPWDTHHEARRRQCYANQVCGVAKKIRALPQAVPAVSPRIGGALLHLWFRPYLLPDRYHLKK